MCICIQRDYLNPASVKYCPKMVTLPNGIPQLGLYDIWNDYLAVTKNRL